MYSYSFHDYYFYSFEKSFSFNFPDVYSFENSSSLAQRSLYIEYSGYIDDYMV